jgi:altronate hydrolase
MSAIQTTSYIQIHPLDNVLVALVDLPAGTEINFGGKIFDLLTPVSAKHKFTLFPLSAGDEIFMYGVLVGKASGYISSGSAITVDNVVHAAEDYALGERKTEWQKPDITAFADKTFMGFHREDGSVGTANYWIVIPLVFCENRNVEVLKEALIGKLGFKKPKSYENEVDSLIALYQTGKSVEDILNADLQKSAAVSPQRQLFPNIDGIKFLNHDMGCGGTRMDSDTLCGLLAGYITHPNVAGATVLSLGCQHAQASILEDEIRKRDPNFKKPLVILEQQKLGTESRLLEEALKQTFAGLMIANQRRYPSFA